jgi:flagellar hook-associated protein 3 FlgL
MEYNMRVTNQLFFQNTQFNYRTTMNTLYSSNQKLASGLKIQYSYQDSGIYVDAMRLDYEASTLAQTKETSAKAQTFANNTDKAFNQFSSALDQFKVKLVQAANDGAMSATSREAVANDLEGIKNHLIDIANTSINGNFLFSGSATAIKPIAADGTYKGNDESLNALVGSEVQLAYNIDGKNLFLGSSGDYHKSLTTNMPMLNQTALHPAVMNANEGQISEEIYLKETDTIREMVGDIDSDSTNDPDTVFYLSGRNSYGEAFNEKVQMTSDAPISDLMERIGHAYGNTSTRQLVEVSLNNRGQIEIKDLRQGSNQIEFHMFGAVDRAETGGSGNAGNADDTDLNAIFTNPSVDIIEFTKSNFKATPTSDTVASREQVFNAGTFNVGFPMHLENGDPALANTPLQDFMGGTIDEIELNGTDAAGGAVTSVSFAVGAGTTVQDLMNEIENQFGDVSVRLENGQILVEDNTIDPDNVNYGDSSLSITLTSLSGGVNEAGFVVPDALNYDRRGFEHEGNQLSGNVAQIINATNEYATSKTKLIDTAGVSDLDTKELSLTGLDIGGNAFDLIINFDAAGSTFTIGGTNYDILNNEGNATPANEMTYQQLMDIVSMVVAGESPQIPITTTNSAAITTAIGAGTPTQAQLDAATFGATSDEVKNYILDAINYGIDGDVAKRDEALRMADLTQYGDVIKSARMRANVSMDEKGRLEIVDKTSSVTQARLNMFDENADNFGTPSALSFMANDALTIDEPSLNVFEDLDKIIEAVRNGTYYPDGDSSDPRNTGVHNGIERIDHIIDHFTRNHTKIGSLSNALGDSQHRAELLEVNVKSVKSEIIDADYGETMMEFQQLALAYQAMLSSVSKINSLSLVNFM